MRLVEVVVLVVLVGCGGSGSADLDAAVPEGLTPDARLTTTYRETCDGSGAIAVSATHFIDVNDEDQIVRLYERGQPSAALQQLDINAALGLAAGTEADLEDVARIGNRVFVTASHGRKTSGSLDRARYKLAAFDLAGTPPAITLASAGTSGKLLDQMLVTANWDAPNATVIAALKESSDLGDASDPDLAPELNGTNIEALANDGTGKLLVGFRNPRPGNKAIVVTLANPDAALTGTARFAGAAELDLGGLGIRAMGYSSEHQAVMIVAGPHTPGGPFKLYKWTPPAPPVFVAGIEPPPQSAPEAVVTYPGTKLVQIVFDGGDAAIGGVGCKDAPVGERVFRDALVTVD